MPPAAGEVTHPFELATAVWPAGPSRWRAVLDPEWFGSAAPHGGHLAAQMLRAIRGEAAEDELSGRSLSVHFLAAGQPGEIEIETRVERAGRNVRAFSARAAQDGETLALALAALGRPRRGPELAPEPPFELPPPEELRGPSERARRGLPPVMQHYELRFGFGAPRSEEAPRTGGWVRPREPLEAGDVLTTALTDTWMPSMYVALNEPPPTTTVELTVNFLADPAGLPADGWYRVAFSTAAAADGYYREDGEVWGQDGRLLARCSQLGVFLGGRGPRLRSFAHPGEPGA